MILLKLRRLKNRILWKFFKIKDDSYIQNYLTQSKFNYPVVKSIEETISCLIEGNKSIVRFGDGEFFICLGRSISFQKRNKKLRERLIDILKNDYEQNCLIAIVEFNTVGLSPFFRRFWYENIKDICCFLNYNTPYYNAAITRNLNLTSFKRIKTIWDKKNIIFVTGKGSRFNTNHELFENYKSKKEIFTLSINAWNEYDFILAAVLDEAQKLEDPIVICSLGPTATVLVYDLSKKGIRALDLGHITNSYDHLAYNHPKPEDLPVKV